MVTTFEERHPWVMLYLRGALLVAVFVGVGFILDRAQVHSYMGRSVFLAVMILSLGAWARWEKNRREQKHGQRSQR